MKPIVVVDHEYKSYGKRLCGKCRTPLYTYDSEGYIKEGLYCNTCGAKVENFTEGDKIFYVQENQFGYEFFDGDEKARLEIKLENERKISELSHVFTSLDIFLHKDEKLAPSQLIQLKEAKEKIRTVLKEMENNK
jgi:hypothetical protein